MPAKPAITPIFCRRNNVILDWSLCSVTCISSGNYMNATNNSCTNALFRNFKFMNRLLHSWRFWRKSLVLAAIGNCSTKYIKRLGTSNEGRSGDLYISQSPVTTLIIPWSMQCLEIVGLLKSN